MDDFVRMIPRHFRSACRERRYTGTTCGVALGYVHGNLVILHERYCPSRKFR
jgi:uncharacterized protein YcsI (UPF0317 family)